MPFEMRDPPGGTAVRPPRLVLSDTQARTLLWVTMALVAASRIVALAMGRDPGFDQSMLLSNFPLESAWHYFRPLPFFEQTAPLGSVVLIDLLSQAFGPEGHARLLAIRSAAVLAVLIGYYLFYRTLRGATDDLTAALATILIATPTETLLFTSNAKHYVFEFTGAVLAMAAAVGWLTAPGRGAAAIYLAAGVFCVVFAFTAPLILATVGGALVLAVLVRQPGGVLPGLGRAAVWRTVGLATVPVLAAVAFYATFTKTVTALDLAAYADRDGETFLSLSPPLQGANVEILTYLLSLFYKLAEPAYVHEMIWRFGLYGDRVAIHLAFLALSLIGLAAMWRRSVFFAAGTTLGLAGIIALNLMQALPFTAVRHFMFLSPFTVACLALGIITMLAAILRPVGRGGWVRGFVVLLVVGFGSGATLRATHLDTHQVSVHLARIDRIEAPVWIYYGAQPSVRALRRSLLAGRALGVEEHTSSRTSWLTAVRDDALLLTADDYLERSRANLAGDTPIWLLFTHTHPEERVPNGTGRFLDMARSGGRVCAWREDTGSLLAYCARPEAMPVDLLETLSLAPPDGA